MDEKTNRILVRLAIVLGLVMLGVIAWQTFVIGRPPGDTAYLEGDQLFEDGLYERALAKYDDALRQDPDHFHALRARARALMELGRHREALREYALAISRDPEFASLYANRGILYDRMGRYEEAAADYEKALALDPELDKGLHWMTRFLRNQPEGQPTIRDRARYIRAELAKPADQRVLTVPELDQEQRSYKQ